MVFVLDIADRRMEGSKDGRMETVINQTSYRV
jgi:hypothetical protein